jgi:dTDP-4-amino-4,6-dideoxygalactose transaminase
MPMQVPLLDLKLQYARIKDEIQKEINEVLESQNFILGPKVEALEQEMARYLGVRYSIGCSSGTDAILLSLMAIGISPGDLVITTPYTFFATSGSISRLRAVPLFVDIDPLTYTIAPDLMEKKILRMNRNERKRLKAIIPVHLYGQCSDMKAILSIAREHGLKVVEDAAQALGASCSGRKAGSMGDLGCFSFFPSKNLGGYGEGGMVVTSKKTLADKIRMLRVHGSKKRYHHHIVGYNARMDALQGAVLRVKLKYLDVWNEARRLCAERYRELFLQSGLTENKKFKKSPVILPAVKKGNYHIYHQFIIRSKQRNRLKKFLIENSIGCEIYYPIPLHLQECYRDLGYRKGDFPEAEKAAQETLALPIYPELRYEQQEYVVSNIREFYAKFQ